MSDPVAKSLTELLVAARVDALHAYSVLDTPPEQAFDDLTALAAAVCDMPVAMVSLVERDRQWFKSRVGLLISETPIEHSMCAHALHVTDLLEIPDTTLDPRTRHNTLVTGPTAFRFYAGAVMRNASGIDLGTLCVLDTKPRTLTEFQRNAIKALARQAMSQLELRWHINDRDRLLDSERVARTEAERASQMKDEFLATLSHELRTPLNAILGWAQILRDTPGDADDLADGLATIERNARAQTQIIEDLLDMSRIVSGKVTLDVHDLQVEQVVQGALATARPSADAKGLRVTTTIDPGAGNIVGDAGRLQQVLWNLLSNAVKFTPRGGKINVAVIREQHSVDIEVTDSGEGIAVEFLPFVFDRFRQADASTTRRHGGLGLGLSIVKQLVELHGGTVRALSDGKGTGTTFVLTLPAIVPTAGPVETSKHSPRPFAGAGTDGLLAGLTVIAIDDDADARSLVARVLRDHGAIVSTASNAAEAFELAKKGKADALVSDIGMPGEDGLSLLRRVRALPATEGGNIPAIALTAYARTEDRDKAMSAGYQAHLVKPFSAAELINTVAMLTGRRG